MQILYKLQIVNNKFTLSLYTESMKTLFLMLIITFLIKPFQLSTVYFVLFVSVKFKGGTNKLLTNI